MLASMDTLKITSWMGQSPVSSGAEIPFHSPFDGRVLAQVCHSDAMDVVKALGSAKKALEPWSALTQADRASFLEKISHHLHRESGAFAREIAEFEGWSASFAKTFFVEPMISLFRKTAEDLRSQDWGDLRKPTGILTILLPSVASFRVLGERLAPALAAGNVALVKISTRSPGTLVLWKKLLEAAEIPDGVVSLLIGKGSEIGDLMIRHPSVHGVSFAGRPETAVEILKNVSAMGKKIQISAGAKNSLLIHPEADFSKLPEMLSSVLTGAGKIPWAMSRIYVSEGRSEEFFEVLKKYMTDLKPLTSTSASSPWTPLSPRFDRAAWSAMKELVRQDHGKFIVGGEDEGSFHVRPLFVRDLTNCSTLQLEELAAPLVIVTTVKYPHEMVKWTNTGDFGVCASIWGPVEKAQKLAAKLEVAEAWVNGWWTGDEAFAGLKRSFFGIPDFHWKGSFFSDVKKLTTS